MNSELIVANVYHYPHYRIIVFCNVHQCMSNATTCSNLALTVTVGGMLIERKAACYQKDKRFSRRLDLADAVDRPTMTCCGMPNEANKNSVGASSARIPFVFYLRTSIVVWGDQVRSHSAEYTAASRDLTRRPPKKKPSVATNSKLHGGRAGDSCSRGMQIISDRT